MVSLRCPITFPKSADSCDTFRENACQPRLRHWRCLATVGYPLSINSPYSRVITSTNDQSPIRITRMRKLTCSSALNSGRNSDVSITQWGNFLSDSDVMHKVSGSLVPSLEEEFNRNKLKWQGNILCMPTERLPRYMQLPEENHNWKNRWIEVVNRCNSKAWKQPMDWLV